MKDGILHWSGSPDGPSYWKDRQIPLDNASVSVAVALVSLLQGPGNSLCARAIAS